VSALQLVFSLSIFRMIAFAFQASAMTVYAHIKRSGLPGRRGR
jgi:hypothetical protein